AGPGNRRRHADRARACQGRARHAADAGTQGHAHARVLPAAPRPRIPAPGRAVSRRAAGPVPGAQEAPQMNKLLLAALLLAVSLPTFAAEPKTTPSVTAQLDRTAIWVGDSLRYTLRVVHEGNVELVLDNFTRERLPLSPFMVRDIDIKRGAWTGGKRSAE